MPGKKFPRSFWVRHPATRVVPDGKKQLSKNWCRKKGRLKRGAPCPGPRSARGCGEGVALCPGPRDGCREIF
jgi:hypothetical protein